MRRVVTTVGLVTTAALGVSLAAAAPPAAPHLPGGAATYRIKLDRFVAPPNRAAGLLVRARINGGPQLNLLVDSGTQYVVVDRTAALRSHCAGGANLEMVGAGAASATLVKHGTADTLELGDVTLRGVPVVVANRALADGIQGALPLSIFAGFIIRLDFRAKELDLLPYGAGDAVNAGAVPVLSSNQLLFVKGTVNEAHVGYFLLDTGAAFTAISRVLARQLAIPEMLAAHVPLRGGVAEIDAPLLSGSVRLQFVSRQAVTGPVVAVDLSTASRYHGFEVSGLIGYSALCDSVLVANYRDGLIRIEPK
jgi:predicted aspartyl protease